MSEWSSAWGSAASASICRGVDFLGSVPCRRNRRRRRRGVCVFLSVSSGYILMCLMCLMSFHARCCQSWKTNPGESNLAEFGYHCRGGCDKCNTHGHLDQGRPSLRLWHLMFCHWSISWFVSHVSLFQHSNLSWHKSYVCFVNHEAHLEMFAYMFLASKQAIKHLMERYISSSDTKPFGEFSHAIILTPHVLLNQITYCQTSFSQIQLIPVGPRYG